MPHPDDQRDEARKRLDEGLTAFDKKRARPTSLLGGDAGSMGEGYRLLAGLIGGVVLTASGLTFVGGTDDFRFRAFGTATGEKLWEIKLPSSVETTPITYQGADGRQFVTVVSTGGGLTGSQVTNDEIIAFALPKT